jgi:hypothetical protein
LATQWLKLTTKSQAGNLQLAAAAGMIGSK